MIKYYIYIIFDCVFYNDKFNSYIILCPQYLTMLREQELQKWIFEENHDINEMLFRFKDKEEPQGYVEILANRYQSIYCMTVG